MKCSKCQKPFATAPDGICADCANSERTVSCPSDATDCSALARLAEFLEMPVDHVREAAEAIRDERKAKLVSALMQKVNLTRDRNTAILPTGEIVARGTPRAIPYDSPQNS